VKAEVIATLLVSCPDRQGIVAALAQLLYGHGANILDADQHTDLDVAQFFQRIRFDLARIHTDRVTLEHAIAEVSQRFEMKWQLCYEQEPKRAALFVSQHDHCLYDLLLRHRAGELRCEIPLIVSNHEQAGSIAAQFGVAFAHVPITADTKLHQERQELQLLQEHRINLAILARYMQVLSSQFLEQFAHPVINIHHSFLPAFVGERPYHQAKQRGVKLIGATAHYVTSELDQGPIVEQDVVRVSHRDDVADMVRKGRDLEKVVLARAVRAHLENRVLVYGNKTVVFD
jgi:formyltetrahydrofolate deformylase